MKYLLVLTTAANRKQAARLAEIILTSRTAACVNVGSTMESFYWWKNKKQKAKEVPLFIKTTARAYPRLEKIIRENHSYEVPEIIGIPISVGSKSYLNWIAIETSTSM